MVGIHPRRPILPNPGSPGSTKISLSTATTFQDQLKPPAKQTTVDKSPGDTFQARNKPRIAAVGARSAVLLCSLLSIMFSIEASDVERLIKISWSGQVDSDEMRRCAEEMRVTASKMRPGFSRLG